MVPIKIRRSSIWAALLLLGSCCIPAQAGQLVLTNMSQSPSSARWMVIPRPSR